MAKRATLPADRTLSTLPNPLRHEKRRICGGALQGLPYHKRHSLSLRTRAKLRDLCIALSCMTASFLLAVCALTLLLSFYPDYCSSLNVLVQ
ncbi:hypothetical protein M514_08087 [Trichuris suis]|uniref:Uncharacterized protein n=1 Tax=Trichuris suis TaxID=68888 RepID=A0A085M1F0_9BILA|nr:hypothetical protein M513_08087 [Trichuris suis]KFD73261.1 hypothetical protein M514_08087 [Trichuris suis]